ncbi:MAG TPA: ATP-binding protein [Gemmatimonadales bacterium]|nr:ATP-binding protein [Gemmatimonadales bacterium]
MQSIRFRLAVSYSLALTATIVLFGAAVYWERRESATREAEQQLDAEQQLEADIVMTVLKQEAKALPSIVTAIPNLGTTHDSTYQLVGEVRAYLDGMRDYLFLSDGIGAPFYVSPLGRSIDPHQLIKIRQMLLRYPIVRDTGTVELTASGAPFHYVVLPVDSAGPHIRALVVAAQPRIEQFGPQELLVSMFLLAPLILVSSALLGYWLAGRSLLPVEVMIEELGAIQDGRSLHRRLAVPPGHDELSRLAQKLNAMLGRVEHSFVALRRFTADASHELKTPLMVLRAGVERALTHPQTPDDIVASLDETLRQINQMTELVTNLLTLARADEGRSGLALGPCDLKALVAEAAETAEILGAERGVAVEVELPAGPLVVSADAPRIRQLLMNLVTNAVKYTPSGGQARLVLTESTDSAVISMQDTGIGIAPGDLPNVFERFWRADLARTRTGEHPGTGLGLAISKWIAEAHGGSISAQSRPGRGSIFTVTIPRMPGLPPVSTNPGDEP